VCLADGEDRFRDRYLTLCSEYSVDPSQHIEVLGWAIRRREEREAVRDIRMLRGIVNALVYVQDPKQFTDFGEIMEPLMPDWMKAENKKAMDGHRRADAQKRFKEAMSTIQSNLRGRQ